MDSQNHAIRMVDVDGIVTTIAGNTADQQPGYVDGPGPTARFFRPYFCVADDRGNIYVSDGFNTLIRYLEYTGDPLIGNRFGPKGYGTPGGATISPLPTTSPNAPPLATYSVSSTSSTVSVFFGSDIMVVILCFLF
jgi:hypothetical protein